MAKPSKKESKKEESAKRSGIKKGFFSGGWLTSEFIQNQRWYILFIFGLALFYISYRYYAEQTIYESEKLEAEVNALEKEYIFKSEELVKIYRRSEILKKIQQKGLDLVEPKEAPKRIEAK